MDELSTYFDTLQLVWLDNADGEFLDMPITVEEIVQIISALPSDKAPGLGGFTTSFYKEYATLLALPSVGYV